MAARKTRRRKRKSHPPRRRELGSALCLILGLCVFFYSPSAAAPVVGWVAALFQGLLGATYRTAVPVLLWACLTLAYYRKQKESLVGQLACTLTLPVVTGALFCLFQEQMPDRSGLELSDVISALWTEGQSGGAGGLLTEGLAELGAWALSVPFSVVLLALGWVFLAMAAIRRSPLELLDWIMDRLTGSYEEFAYEEPRRKRKKDQLSLMERLQGLLPARKPAKALPPAQRSQKTRTAPSTPQPPAQTVAPVPLRGRSQEPPAAEKTAAAAETPPENRERPRPGPAAGYQYPPMELLKENDGANRVEVGAELRENAQRLRDTLHSFGVEAKLSGRPIHGPSVTRYDFQLEQGIKLSKITNLSDDIALSLGSTGVRIAPIPTKNSVVGIEVPNRQVIPVLIRDVVDSDEFQRHPSQTAFALGKDINGRNIIGCIERLPHVLIAGTTGSGKSVCMNCLIISLLYKSTPQQVRFIMVDPKMVELAPYNGIPHLLIPVVTDPRKAAGALQWAVGEMMRRYKTFSEQGVKKLEEYNRLSAKKDGPPPLPSVVVVIDELADLMLVAAKEVEESIMRVAQMGRAAGIHLVIATQRPSADVITGLMKANIPSRIAFAVASSIESRIILDTTGAEKLVGRGDMLYAPLGEGRIRVQGCFISPEEIERVVSRVKSTTQASYDQTVMASIEASVQEVKAPAEPEPEADDELLPKAVDAVLETGQASVSLLQRKLKLGYSRAARLVDQMEERGYVGPFEGSRPRQILITPEQWQSLRAGEPVKKE